MAIASWLTLGATSGSGGRNVSVRAGSNDTTLNSRSTSITIKTTSGISKSVSISQSGLTLVTPTISSGPAVQVMATPLGQVTSFGLEVSITYNILLDDLTTFIGTQHVTFFYSSSPNAGQFSVNISNPVQFPGVDGTVIKIQMLDVVFRFPNWTGSYSSTNAQVNPDIAISGITTHLSGSNNVYVSKNTPETLTSFNYQQNSYMTHYSGTTPPSISGNIYITMR